MRNKVNTLTLGVALLGVLTVVATPAAAQFAGSSGPPGVIVEPARVEPFPLSVEALGTASANEAVNIRPVITATLTAIHFEEGDYVEAGTVLAELENVEPLADLAGARAAYVETEAQFNRLSELYKTQAVSQSQVQQLEAQLEANRAVVAAAEARLAHTVVTAPFSGHLGLRRVSVGSLVGPDTVITTLDDTSTIKLDFDVPEVFLARLEPGLEATARSAAYPDLSFTGVVTSVDSRVDPVSRTVTVRSRVENESGRLRAGMFLTVSLLKQNIRSLVVPEQAIVPDQSRQFVWIIGDGDIAEMREVHTGRRRPGEVEILGGLQVGDRVITEGTQKARAGEAVTVIGGAT